MRLFSGSSDSSTGSSLTGGESVVAVKGTCLIVVVGAIEVVVGVTTTVEVELLLSGWVLLVELLGIVSAGCA